MSQTNNQSEPITSFSDFIDSITNKLTVYGIFNALLIFSLTLKGGAGQLFLFISSLLLNFLFLALIIHISYKKCLLIYERKAEAVYYGIFIVSIAIAFVGLLIYSIAELPDTLGFIISTFLFYLTGVVVCQVFLLIEKFSKKKYSGLLVVLFIILLFPIVNHYLSTPLTIQTQLYIKHRKLK